MLDTKLLESLNDATNSCISCGFCESVCPTLPASDFNLSRGARGRVLLGKALYKDLKETGKTEISLSDSFYSCLDCFACVQVCPAGVNAGEVSDIVKEMINTRDSPLSDQEKNVARMIVNATMKYGNPLGLRKKAAKWAESLSFDDSSDTLLYTGNMYQLMSYSKTMGRMKSRMGESVSERMAGYFKSTPSLLKLAGLMPDSGMKREMESSLHSIYSMLRKSGVRFRYLRDMEPYPGTFLYDLGYMEEFGKYARSVSELFIKEGVKRIITIDPHTHNVLKNNYPKFVTDFPFEVVYYLDLIDDSKLKSSEIEVNYHEPCYFTLRKDTYDKPDTLLSHIGKVNKPRRSGKSDFCCGGPAELLYPDLAHRVSEERVCQLKSSGKGKTVTACPICYANLDRGSDVTDIANYLNSNMSE